MASTHRALMATASLAALLAGGAAHAASTPINGGGSTLAYPTYLAEFTSLYSVNTAFIFGNTKVTPPVTYFGSVGSGGGTTGFLNNDYTQDNGGTVAPVAVFGAGTTVHYGASDSVLTSAQVTAYNTSPGLGTVDGPLIQLPAFGVPITVPFDDGAATAVTLTDNDLCGIFSGKLTNWSQTSAAGKVPANPITVVFRADGSGTTFLFTNHLASVCTTANSNFSFSGSTALVGTQYFGGLFTTLPSNFATAKGSGGIQSAILAIQAASATNPVTISGTYLRFKGDTGVALTTKVTAPSAGGYVGPDYTSIAPKSANYNAKVLVASLVNATNGTAYLPTTANTTSALATSAAPPSTKATAANPTLWVPLTPKPTQGYPIVGFTNLIVSQCYKVANVTTGIKTFLTYQYNNNANFLTAIGNSGFVPVPNLLSATYVTAINNDFLTNNSGYNLNIGNTTVCGTGTGQYAGR
jgi:phosphate transport system substrate-binding protein